MNNGDMRYKLLQPWSTFVMITKVPPSILEKMIKITDEIVTNVKSMSPGATGSGQLKDEFSLEQEILEREGLLKYFLHMTRQFVIEQTLQQNPLTEEKKLNNDKWYTYDDTNISEISRNNIKDIQAYILCYIKNN